MLAAVSRSQRARELLPELVPNLLTSFGASANPDTAFRRFDEFLGRLPAGVQFFSLFYNNPGILSLVAEIMGAGTRLADAIARRPMLLDAVLAATFLEPPPARAELATELDATLDRASHYEEMLDLATEDEPVHVAGVDGDASRHERARVLRGATPCDGGEEPRGRPAGPVEDDAGARPSGRWVVDAHVVLGEMVGAPGEMRQEPGRHRPCGGHEAIHPQPCPGEHAFPLLDPRAALVRGHVAELGLAAGGNTLGE